MKPERILVRGPNWLGDLAMSTPGFRALRGAFPDAHIALHAGEGLLPLLAGAPWFDEVLPVRSYHAGWAALVGEGRRLSGGAKYDLGICIPDSWSSVLLMRIAGVREVVGHRQGGREWLLHRTVDTGTEKQKGRRRLVARERHVLELMGAVGAPALGTELELFTTSDEESRAEALWAETGLDAGLPCIGLAPGAGYGPAKQWPVASFARVGDSAAARGFQVVILGSPAEAGLGREVADAMEQRATVLAGRLDLGTLKAAIRRLRALVCNDAGARHVAVAFGVPCVVLFGPTSVEKTDWNLERVRVVETDVDCRPCYERVCPIDHRCMTRLHPDRVTDALEHSLAENLAAKGRRGVE